MQGWLEIESLDISDDAMFVSACGAVGREGPTWGMCKEAYKDSRLESMLVDVVDGVQAFKIPDGGVWKILAYGARGGNAQLSSSYPGGKGAMARSSFAFQAGDIINIVVGQPGSYRAITGVGSQGGSFSIYTLRACLAESGFFPSSKNKCIFLVGLLSCGSPFALGCSVGFLLFGRCHV